MSWRDRFLALLGLEANKRPNVAGGHPPMPGPVPHPRNPPVPASRSRRAGEDAPPAPAHPAPADGAAAGEGGIAHDVLDLVSLVVEDYERWRREIGDRPAPPGSMPVSWLSSHYAAVAPRRIAGRILVRRLSARLQGTGLGRVVDAMKADRVQEG